MRAVLRFRAGETGMSTAEYAIGTVAVCAFAAVLYKVITSTRFSTCSAGWSPARFMCRSSRSWHPADRDAGYVTAETAMVLPVLAILLAVGLWAIAVAGAQVRCIDAARDAARAVARGESDAAATAAATAAAPDGAHVDVRHDGGRIVVVVSAAVGKGFGPLAAISVPTVSATATAESEADP